MNKTLIANWKMNPVSELKALKLLTDIGKGAGKIDPEKIKVVFCPPSVFIKSVSEKIKRSSFLVGAQNVFWENSGTFTGEVSSEMLESLGCRYCIVGHSERKKYFNETLEDVGKKVLALLKKDVVPVVCVGEEKRTDKKLSGIENQINKILQDIPKAKISDIIFVYEPAWAISDGEKAVPTLPSSNDILSAKLLIQKCLAKKISRNKIIEMSILYGGSVNAGNVDKFVGENLMDGALIGGASLKAKEFVKIISASS